MSSEVIKTAYVFPGQGAQKPGMARDIYDAFSKVREMYARANEILGFSITDIMFGEDEEALRQTKVTQPAVFLHSVGCAAVVKDFRPDMVAGHSLGEFSALVAAGAMDFEDGLRLVSARAFAMQKACEKTPSTMAAIINLPDEKVDEICSGIEGVVVPANFNSPGQVVISGSLDAVQAACEACRAAGAKRALPLKVGGAFHSPFMESAREELAEAIMATRIVEPICPVYQNVDARPHTSPEEIKENLLMQLTSPVRWTATVANMCADGAFRFVELGPGEVLRGLIKRCTKEYVFPGMELAEDGIVFPKE